MSKKLLSTILCLQLFSSIQILSQNFQRQRMVWQEEFQKNSSQGFYLYKLNPEKINPPHENLQKYFNDINNNLILQYQGDTNYRRKETLDEKWDGAVWVSTVKTLYAYNEAGKQTEQKTQNWMGLKGWKDTLRYIYNYEDSLFTAFTYQRWNGIEWLNITRYAYSYDGFGYSITSLIQTGDSLSWDNIERVIYYRNNSTHKSDSSLTQVWSMGAWTNSSKYIYIENSQVKDSIITFYKWNGTEWVNSSRTLYSYEASTMSYNQTEQSWSGTGWINLYKYFSNYDINKNDLGYVSQVWDGTTWINNDKDIITYNAQNNVTERLYQTWDGAVWVNLYNSIYTYDSNNNNTSVKYQTFSMGSWVDIFLYLNTYNSNNLQTSETDQTFDGTVWNNTIRYTYTYELVVGIKNQIISAENFKLYDNYPNPFNPSTKIKFVLPSSSFVNLKVYDILGREVKALINEEKSAGQYEIEFKAGGELSSGIYFFKLEASSLENKNNFVTVKKMVLLK